MEKVKKPKSVKVLQITHFTVFILAISIISLQHIFTQNFLDILRMPAYVKAIDPWAASDWPGNFHFYHVVLIFYISLTFINGMGLFYYSKKFIKSKSRIQSKLPLLILLFFL